MLKSLMKKSSILILLALTFASCTMTPSEVTEVINTEDDEIVRSVEKNGLSFSRPSDIITYFKASRANSTITTSVDTANKLIIQDGTVNGTKFRFTLDLVKWDGYTLPYQLRVISNLFWDVYPAMYKAIRNDGTPTTVTIAVENMGYEVAWTMGNFIHIHDKWLHNNPKDFDCLTHELAHVIQAGWLSAYQPSGDNDWYTSFTERYADACRYIFAYGNGKYNDQAWTLQPVSQENTYQKSVRFYVWLEYKFGTSSYSVLKKINNLIYNKKYKTADWDPNGGKAWKKVFKGTSVEDTYLTTLFKIYKSKSFATLSSTTTSESGKSALDKKYSVRSTIEARY